MDESPPNTLPGGAGEVRRATRRARRTLGDEAADIRGRGPRDEHDRFFASAFGAIGDCSRRGGRAPHPGTGVLLSPNPFRASPEHGKLRRDLRA